MARIAFVWICFLWITSSSLDAQGHDAHGPLRRHGDTISISRPLSRTRVNQHGSKSTNKEIIAIDDEALELNLRNRNLQQQNGVPTDGPEEEEEGLPEFMKDILLKYEHDFQRMSPEGGRILFLFLVLNFLAWGCFCCVAPFFCCYEYYLQRQIRLCDQAIHELETAINISDCSNDCIDDNNNMGVEKFDDEDDATTVEDDDNSSFCNVNLHEEDDGAVDMDDGSSINVAKLNEIC